MENTYCLDLEFPEVNFDNYWVKCDVVTLKHHAHLISKSNEIVIRVYYDFKTHFDKKFSTWASTINWRKFGSYVIVSGETENERVQKIDLSEAQLVGFHINSDFVENGKMYFVINIDTVKTYWNPVKEEVNTAEFYLNEAGFRVVKGFYSTLFGWDGKFEITRMNEMHEYYSIGTSEFRPEYNFCLSDDRDKREASVTKEPKIQFRYKERLYEEEAWKYAQIVRLIASFYFNTNIDFTLSRIHLPDNTITIKKIDQKEPVKYSGGLTSFKSQLNFHKLLLSNWQSNLIENFQKLSKAIELFNQAILVDSNSEFLIRYNIIEICNTVKQTTGKFKEIIDGNAKQKKYSEALGVILETIDKEEHEDFTKKWTSLIGKLVYKPMKSPLITFLESQKLNPAEFPISIDELNDLRNNITHGSINNVDPEQLRKANTLLYRINGIIILNLMGISDWKLNTVLQ
jgi:hypothetical protein